MLGNKEIMAKNILRYMELHNKSRNDMCEALGVKYTTFTDWVKGKSYPRIDKIELMANYFGISKADLVEDTRREPIDFLLFNTDDRDSPTLIEQMPKSRLGELRKIVARLTTYSDDELEDLVKYMDFIESKRKTDLTNK